MYRAYKRTGIASYVRYTCFKVAVSFLKWGYPENIQFCAMGYPGMATPMRNFRRFQGQESLKMTPKRDSNLKGGPQCPE